MHEINHRRVLTNNLELHIAEIGEGPLILFIHGFPGVISFRQLLKKVIIV